MRNSRRAMRKYRRARGGEDINPMNFVSNLSDVMLILAVGIMIALVLHWNVPLNVETKQDDSNSPETITFDADDLESKEIIPENLEHMGQVYYDEKSGEYIIIKD